MTSRAIAEVSLSGDVIDGDEVALPGAVVQVLSPSETVLAETKASATGEFSLSGIEPGEYDLSVTLAGFHPYRKKVRIEAGGTTVHIRLLIKEMVLRVEAKRKASVSASSPVSSTAVNREDIKLLPQGEQIRLPKLLAITTPGVVQGAFGQLFFRGNHANIQYQIDGVQLPDSLAGTFGDAFAPRNIDHMEVITGGIPAEYGQRLSAVVNIVTRKGDEKLGGSAEVNYGSYNFFSPTISAGGAAGDSGIRYFFSANYNRTDRGLDTPQPASPADVTTGTTESVHNQANGHNEFGRVDWQLDNANRLSLVLFNSQNSLEIPNFPSRFNPTDSIFTVGDSFGNDPYLYRPSTTDNSQREQNAYVQTVWRHTFSERSFLQVAPYWKYSYLNVKNDPVNDLAGATLVPVPPGGQGNVYASFAQNRNVNNVGVKLDQSYRWSDRHLFKAGLQVQGSKARGSFTVMTAQSGQPNRSFTDDTPTDSYFGGVYLQDEYTISEALLLRAGLRFDTVRFELGPGETYTHSGLQPRLGLSYLVTEGTKLHVFYGKLFQPAPAENLRRAFNALTPPAPGQSLPSYDIKPERADYAEAGVTQDLGFNHVAALTAYAKYAENLLDDAQLFNTAIAQPINFAYGYIYGAELSLKGQLAEGLTDYLNYSYSLGKGKGLGGGLFTGEQGSADFQYLDHQQFHTLNAGVTYRFSDYWVTGQALYGSGLRTGPDNSVELPGHFTLDTTVGYAFPGLGLKLSLDVLNIFDNRYPVTIANGLNGSHYAAGRQFIGHLVKEL